jgi:TetR/AcrR family transcriptional repressor of nem operon
MARKSKEATAESKAKIVREAARLFRLRGYEGISLDDIMKAAGLTVGTFYAHFSSKRDLFREVLEYGNRKAYETLMPASVYESKSTDWLFQFIENYITEKHRDKVAEGCLYPLLSNDVSRSGTEAKTVFESAIKGALERRAEQIRRGGSLKQAEDQILSALCLGVGALALSRAVASKDFSKRILDAARMEGLKGKRKG